MTIRAKFRCMSVTEVWDRTVRADLKPVTKKYHIGNEPLNFPENTRFWSATPSGEASLTFKPEAQRLFRAGDYYYVDMEPISEEPTLTSKDSRQWTLVSTTAYGENGEGTAEFAFHGEDMGPDSVSWGTLKIGLSGGSVKLRDFGLPAKKWRIDFSFANDRSVES